MAGLNQEHSVLYQRYTHRRPCLWTNLTLRLDEYVVENHPHMTVNRITVMKLNELWEQQFKADFPECVQEEQIGMSKEDHQFMDCDILCHILQNLSMGIITLVFHLEMKK